jgi:hypothetical protein
MSMRSGHWRSYSAFAVYELSSCGTLLCKGHHERLSRALPFKQWYAWYNMETPIVVRNQVGQPDIALRTQNRRSVAGLVRVGTLELVSSGCSSTAKCNAHHCRRTWGA